MDKFLELIKAKKLQVDILKETIDSFENELMMYHNKQNVIENKIFCLVDESNNNANLIKKIIGFPKFKKNLIMAEILAILISGIIFPIPIITFLFLIKSEVSIVIFLTILLDLFVALEIYFMGKNILNEEKQKIQNFTIEDLRERNNNIEKEIGDLENQKINNNIVISNLMKKIEQNNLELSNLCKDIIFVENIRNESIERLCPEILDKQFAIEESNPAFQKILSQGKKD